MDLVLNLNTEVILALLKMHKFKRELNIPRLSVFKCINRSSAVKQKSFSVDLWSLYELHPLPVHLGGSREANWSISGEMLAYLGGKLLA